MNYNSAGTIAFTIKKGRLDINGNTVTHITFYKKVDGTWIKYKTARTNEYLGNVSCDKIVDIWG